MSLGAPPLGRPSRSRNDLAESDIVPFGVTGLSGGELAVSQSALLPEGIGIPSRRSDRYHAHE
jgi:hypothetical protein